MTHLACPCFICLSAEFDTAVAKRNHKLESRYGERNISGGQEKKSTEAPELDTEAFHWLFACFQTHLCVHKMWKGRAISDVSGTVEAGEHVIYVSCSSTSLSSVKQNPLPRDLQSVSASVSPCCKKVKHTVYIEQYRCRLGVST